MMRWSWFLVLTLPALALAQPKPPVRVGHVESVGALSKKTTKARVRAALPALRACVLDERGKPKVAGVAVFRGLIAPDGTMLASEVASSSLGDRAVERCLSGALEAIAFPAAQDERDTHLHVQLLVGDEARPSADTRRATAGPGDPEFDAREDPTPDVPEAPPSAQVLVQIRAHEGSLSADSVERATSRAVRAFRTCYEPRLAASPGLTGRIAFRSRVSPNGEVSHIEVKLSTLPEELTACVVRAAQLLPFEAPTGPVIAEWAVLLAPPVDAH